MSSVIHLGPDLPSLPLDASTQTFLIVGKRGSGKSNTAARLVEQFYAAKIPVVVLDPTDTWWGVKANRDGGKGLGIYIFGGSHADLPLEPGGGALIADVLCEHRIPMVLSVKHLSGRQRSDFMVAFAQTVWKKWAGGPLHLVLEEAHEFAPQSVQQAREGEQQMLGAFKRLWKLGRASGIGGTAITQRPAALSKDITTQSEILIAHRIIGPQDVAAVGEWIKYHGEHNRMLGDLPSLPTGEAFVWAPEFPEGKPLGLKRSRIALRQTYDSASTPKVGEVRVEPKELAQVDLQRLRTQMAATIEKTAAEDPKALRARIADLERQLAEKDVETKIQFIDRPIISDTEIQRMETVADRLREIGAELAVPIKNAYDVIRSATQLWATPRAVESVAHREPRAVRDSHNHSVPSAVEATRIMSSIASSVANTGTVTKEMPRKMLTALAQHGPLSKGKILAYTGYRSSGPVSGVFAELTRSGLVEMRLDRCLVITDRGRSALGHFDRLPTGAALRSHVLENGKLSNMEARMLGELFNVYPHAIAKGDVLRRLGYASSGPVSSAFARLVAIDYAVKASHGQLRAADVFFEGGKR